MASYAITGMGFGDEGKGSIISYLSHKNPDIKTFSKYNGGCQAKHTIESNGKTFSFAQMSSGMLSGGETYLTENFVINLFSLVEEIKAYVNFTKNIDNVDINDIKEVLSRIYIDEKCLIVTPFHKIINIYEELTSSNPRGSVGTGVSVAKKLNEIMPAKSIKAMHIYNKHSMTEILKRQHRFLKITISEEDLDIIKAKDEAAYNYVSHFMSDDGLIEITNSFAAFAGDFKLNIVKNSIDLLKTKDVLYEGSQGVLIDREFGIKPNITYLDTTNNSLDNTDVKKIGVIRAYYTRHGQGAFPTEDKELNKIMSDNSQEIGRYNGKIRFGWFDAVLFRYACKVSPIDEVYLTCLDNLFPIEEVKLCTSYYYEGDIDEKFKDIFEYENCEIQSNGLVQRDGYKITNILKNDDNLGYYLNKCEPIYETLTIGKKNYIRYLAFINSEIKVPIRLVSMGPTVSDKISLRGNIICSRK